MLKRARTAFNAKIAKIQELAQNLSLVRDLKQKITILNQNPGARAFLSDYPPIQPLLKDADQQTLYVFLAIGAIGEGPIVFRGLKAGRHRDRLNKLVSLLMNVDKFYDHIGGLVGYHCAVLRLLEETQGGGGGAKTFATVFKTRRLRHNARK